MKKHPFPVLIFVLYYIVLVRVMVFKDVPIIRIGNVMLNFGGTDAGSGNFVPFKTIVPYLLGNQGAVIAGTNLAGNVALLVPLGFLAAFIFRNMTWKKALTLAVTIGLSIELMQAVFHVGIFDIDDVQLNALGVMIGYWAFTILAKWLRAKNYKNILIAVILVIAVFLGTFYAVFPHSNHAEGAIPKNSTLCNDAHGTGQIIKASCNYYQAQRRRHSGY